VAGTIGSIQATEAIKYLTGFEEGLLLDRLLTYDAAGMAFRLIAVKKKRRLQRLRRDQITTFNAHQNRLMQGKEEA
jgi:hypothetical protein